MERVESVARPAEPLLAVSLVGDEELEASYDRVVIERKGAEKKEEVLRFGVKSLDDALEGGLEGGRVVGMSGEIGGAGTELCLSLLANSLLQKPISTAAIIDTTGNLDILRLYTLLLSGLQSDTSLLKSVVSSSELENISVEDVAAKMLDRVKIMRVFDLVGVMEAVSEIRDGLEGRKPTITASFKEVDEQEKGMEEPQELPPKRTEIADSEDEDEDEILFDTEDTGNAESVAIPQEQDEPNTVPKATTSTTLHEERPASEGKISFILIDNVAHVVSPLLKKDYIQAHALTSSFLLSLSHLTRTHNLHTLLLNPSPPPRPPPSKPATGLHVRPQQQPPPPPSFFSSNKLVPALGNLLSPFLDLHLMVSKVPRRKADARLLYGDSGGARLRKGPEMVNVVEILSDRWGGMVGAWGTFVEGEKGIRGA